MYNVDSNYQWDHASGRYPFDDLHPPLFAVFMMPWARTGSSIWGFVVTQQVIVVGAMTWAVNALLDAGVELRKAWWAPAAFILLPMVPLYSLTVYKDVYYSVAVLAMTMVFLRTNAAGGAWSRSDATIFVVGALATYLIRHNGPPVAALCVAAAVAAGPFTLRWRAAFVATFFLLAIGLGHAMTSAFHIYHRTSAEVVLPHHLAAHLHAGDITDPADLALLNRIRSIDDGWGYDCRDVSPTIYRRPYDVNEASRQVKALWRIWWRAAVRHPLVQARHMACAAQLVWNPFLPVRDTIPFEITPDTLWYIADNHFGFKESSKDLPMARSVAGFYDAFKNSPVNQPAWYLYGLCWISFVACRRTRRWRDMLPMVPVIAQSFFMAISNHDQQVRYQLPVFFVFPFLILAYARLIELNPPNESASAASSDASDTVAPATNEPGR